MNFKDPNPPVSQESLRAIARAKIAPPPSVEDQSVILGTLIDAALTIHPYLAENLMSPLYDEKYSNFRTKVCDIREDLAAHFHEGNIPDDQIDRTLEAFEILHAQISDPELSDYIPVVCATRNVVQAAFDFKKAAIPVNPESEVPRYDTNPFTAMAVVNESLMLLLPKIEESLPGFIGETLGQKWQALANQSHRRFFWVREKNAKDFDFVCERLEKLSECIDKIVDAAQEKNMAFAALHALQSYIAPYKPQSEEAAALHNNTNNVVQVNFSRRHRFVRHEPSAL